MSIEPDYKNYSTAELEEAMGSIDRASYPERFKTIESELLKSQPVVVNEENPIQEKSIEKPTVPIVTKTDGKIVHFIIRLWCVGLFYIPYNDLYEAYFEGTTYTRHHGLITYSSEPILFTIEIGKSIFFAAILILGFIKNPFDYKALISKPYKRLWRQ
ncbi:hypothetical protein FX988_00720 [Paraglaciecola mesophila]|uniref:Uncharacterized protein n=1 Tax=Paraglaciecola mesophila TaxID=197222 RepID=A0A857JFQ9_9ALTE|nr:hypothetical protein [Paraglaciecola mesophila]QHJ10506.1 hypothetical protein FX988_00720 [Paraglaciecola mesophila]